MSSRTSFDFSALMASYGSGALTPVDVARDVLSRIEAAGDDHVWIARVPAAELLARAEQLAALSSAGRTALPLYGIPFAVKDNIDVAGLPTTAACPSFAYEPTQTAPVVQRLLDAGAILIGKTNLDQFATGLVGTRSPYGACGNAFDDRYISGGSSSGSAIAVAKGQCAFSLGTDTAGSGRVPAALNGLVGLKPTRGLLSTRGVVPACRSLDCVSVFTASAAGAQAVWEVARGFDRDDPYSRRGPVPGADLWATGGARVGLPAPSTLEFFGDAEARALFEQAANGLDRIGAVAVPFDWTPFRQAGALLYDGPWVAERRAAVGGFLDTNPPDIDPTVGGIIRVAARLTAADAFVGFHQLQRLKRETEAVWEQVDVLLLPTAPTIYTRAAVVADAVRLNANLGIYTTFANLLDLSVVAIPAGVRSSGLPFGTSLIGRALADASILTLAHRVLGEPVTIPRGLESTARVAVVGAHLSGQPLNHQLVERGGTLLRTTRTAPRYTLHALAGTAPLKPGLVRTDGTHGAAIEVEVWALPMARFGDFVAMIPPPLAMGQIELETGEWVSGFVCEPGALAGAREITAFGGWRAFISSGR